MPLEPVNTIKARLGIDDNGKVQKKFSKLCRVAMDNYVPMKEGRLRANVKVGDDYVEYQTTYAKVQYYGITHGKRIKNYTTPGTGPYWDRRMVSADLTNVLKTLKKEIESNG